MTVEFEPASGFSGDPQPIKASAIDVVTSSFFINLASFIRAIVVTVALEHRKTGTRNRNAKNRNLLSNTNNHSAPLKIDMMVFRTPPTVSGVSLITRV